MHISGRKGYIPRITASRHLIGRASLVISLARSISLWSRTRERCGELEGLHYASMASSALLQCICNVGFQERQRCIKDREKKSVLGRYKSKPALFHILSLLTRSSYSEW